MKMTKLEKWGLWDRMFGWPREQWVMKPWKTKNSSDFKLKDCSGIQLSDPDIPF